MKGKDLSWQQFFSRNNLVMAICFFASGFAGLCYEICWIRKASVIFGSTIFAVSTVTAVFFGGLAIGSYLFGQYSQKLKRPLVLYALLEIGLGVIALLNPLFFSLAEKAYHYFYPSLFESFALLSFTRCILVTLVILPPTIFMGATLPLFCKHYVVREEQISLSVALLYGLNTLGGAVGAGVTGFALIPWIGINTTIFSSGALNILIGIVAYRFQLLPGSPAVSETEKQEEIRYAPKDVGNPGSNDYCMYTLFFLSGFVALGTEVIWVRYLSLLITNTVYTYTLTLTITLIGIVVGSVLISVISDGTKLRAFYFGMAHVLNSLVVLGLVMLPADWWHTIMTFLNSPSHVWIFMLLMLFPAILSGISFPLAIRMVVNSPSQAGSGVGSMYTVNTVGGILGSLAIGFLLLPHIGLQKSLLVTTGMSLLIGGSAWIFVERSVSVSIKAGLLVISLAFWLAIPFVTGTRLPADFLHSNGQELLDYREGYEANLAVNRFLDNNEVALEINRLWQGNNLKNQQIMAAHIPMLLHPEAKNVLVVGVGVGKTASRFLYYDVDRLDCVDVESSLFGIIRKNFDSSWMADNRVRLIAEDGRNYINNTGNKYDVISIEVGQTFKPGISSFYTVDFYQQAYNRLNNNGIICQFIPITFLDLDEFRSMIHTFLKVFPNSILWYNTSELLLIGSPSGCPAVSPKYKNILSAKGSINTDLMYSYFGGADFYLNQQDIFLAGFLCGPESLARMAGNSPVFKDDLPRLEYTIAAQNHASPKSIIDVITQNLDPVSRVLDEKLDGAAHAQIQQVRTLDLNDLVATDLVHLWTNHVETRDLSKIQHAVSLNPYNMVIRMLFADCLRQQGHAEAAQRILHENTLIDPGYKVSKELGRIF